MKASEEWLDKVFKAIKLNKRSDLVELLSRGDVNASTPSGMAPTYEAIKYNRADCLSILIEHGADCERLDFQKRSCVMWAVCVASNGACLRVLLAHGVDVGVCDDRGNGLAGIAAQHATGELYHELLQRAGVDMEVANHKGETAVLIAARIGDAKGLEILGKLGADFSKRDSEGMGCFDYARAAWRSDCLAVLERVMFERSAEVARGASGSMGSFGKRL